MKLKTLQSIDLQNKTILYRAPYDIELKDVGGILEVADDMRIAATVPTLEYLLKQNCKIVILTYVGRPDGKIVPELSTAPHARKLAELLGKPVEKVDDCVGEAVEQKISSMKAGDVLMLENVRFHVGEVEDDDIFAQELCKGKDAIVFDGFPQAHRVHASTTGILRHLPAVAGLYLEHEVEMLTNILDNPKRPLTVIIGGAKISDKIDAVNNLLKIADHVLIGGAVANVFLKAQGHELGHSFIEDVFVNSKRRSKQDWVVYAKQILDQYKDTVTCPQDLMVSDGVSTKVLDITTGAVQVDSAAFDIGPKTQELFSKIITDSKTVFWAGPVGKFEEEQFEGGSQAIIEAMKKVAGETILAGGDTIDVVRHHGNLADYSHVSLAGGATLEFLAGKTLPALVPLMQEN